MEEQGGSAREGETVHACLPGREEQIVRILREVESGTSILEVCRTYGVSEITVHRRRGRLSRRGGRQ
jgi:DNA invertase Pin-like site-specific DNA recombinase